MLHKVRRRSLLDLARQRIIKALNASQTQIQYSLWSAVQEKHTIDDLKDFIDSNNVFQSSLNFDATRLIYVSRVNVRDEGNGVAHEMDPVLIRDAIIEGGLADLEPLKNIFRCLFNLNI